MVYLRTAAPGAWWGDGQEFACAAKILGVPHPTGYPLYVLTGRLLTILAPATDAGRLLTLLSAVLCAAGVGLTGLALGGAARSGEAHGPTVPAFMLLGGLSLTLWDHATFAEVYPLTFFLVAAIIPVLGVRGRADEGRGAARLALGGLLCGLAATNHYSGVAIAPLALAGAIRLVLGESAAAGHRSQGLLSRAALFVASFAVPLFLYLYIPLRAAAGPPLNWGNPVGARGLLWVLRGGDFPAWFLRHGADSGIKRALEWWGVQFVPVGHGGFALAVGILVLGGAVAGCGLMWSRDRALSFGLLAALGITSLFPILYPIPDIDGYMLPALPAALIGGAELFGRAARRGIPGEHACGVRIRVFSFIVAFAALASLPVRHARIDKSGDSAPLVWSEAVMAALPPDAVIITAQGRDTEIYSLWEAQMVRGRRPDVTVFGAGFVFTSWYRNHLDHPSRPGVDVRLFAREPGSKDVYDAALLGGVVARLNGRRVYTTFIDDTLRNYMNPAPVARLLPDTYYAESHYRFALPGRVLYELRPSAESLDHWRRRCDEEFGTEKIRPPREAR